MNSLLRPLLALLLFGVPLGFVTAAMFQEQPSAEGEQSPPAKGQERFREGSKLNKVAGYFKVSVDRVEFHPTDDGPALVVLENLALERVVNELTGDLVLIWHIDGTITEYHGRNYLLLDRAYIRSAREN